MARIRDATTSTLVIGTNDDNNESVAADATIVADATTASGAGAMVEVLNHQDNGARPLRPFNFGGYSNKVMKSKRRA